VENKQKVDKKEKEKEKGKETTCCLVLARERKVSQKASKIEM